MMRERVLITGASGFVGYHLIEAALQANLDVYAAVRPSSHTAHLREFNISYASLDFKDAHALRDTLEKLQCQYIIHAAGTTKAKSEEQYCQVNASYTQVLAQAAAAAKTPLRKFVFVSSLAALGPVAYNAAKPITEETVARPVTNYGKSKLLAEQYLQQVEHLPWVVLRPTAIYGPREKDIFILLKTVQLGLELYIGQQPQWLSFIYVKDLARAVVQAMFSEVKHTSYNVSDGNKYDRYALANATKRQLGKRVWRFHLPTGVVRAAANALEKLYASSDDTPALNAEKLSELTAENWSCSIRRIEQELGFRPEFNLEEGLARTLAWYKENKWL